MPRLALHRRDLMGTLFFVAVEGPITGVLRSGSAVTVALMRRPKYSISTAEPSVTVLGSVPVEEHGFLAQDDGAAVVDAPLLRVDGEAEAGLEGVVLRGDVDAVGPESRLEPEGVEGGAARCDDPLRLAGLPENIPEARAVLRAGVHLPPGLADEGQADDGDGDAGDDGGLDAGVGHVPEVVGGADAGDNLGGPRAPEPDAARAAGGVAHLDELCRRRPRLEAGLPGQVGEVDGPVDGQLEQVAAEPGDEDVAADAAVFVQQKRERDGPGLFCHVARRQPLEQVDGPRAGYLQTADGGEVVHGDGGARLPGLGGGDGRVVPGGPGVAVPGLPLVGQQGQEVLVGLVPLRTLPAAGLEEVGAEVPLAGVEGADAEVARGLARLEGVQDVVDLDEVLGRDLADVVGGEVDLLEARNVALGQVDVGLAGGEELGDGAGDAGRVGDPDGLGDEEAVEVGGAADEGPAVRGEGHDAVEAVVDVGFGEGREQPLGELPGRGEVVRREVEAGRHVALVDPPRGLAQRGRDHGHRAVAVVADAELFAVLAVVEIAVLVPEDRELGVVVVVRGGILCRRRCLAPLRRNGLRLCVLVSDGEKGDGQADHGADLDAPEAGAREDQVGGDDAGGPRGDPRDASVAPLDAGDRGVLEIPDAGGAGALDEQLDGGGGQGQAVGGDVQAAEDDVGAQQGVDGLALGGGEETGLDAPGGGVTALALELLEPLGGLGHLEAADLVEAPHRQQLPDGVLGEGAERLGARRLEHEARRVRR
ncbi:hypothetical protein CTA1_11786 [Colletotrichum tanaceti]|uniref:Uncharacterized protein n=1 Tax=Colletotrichum tanaceti TaxID=1306861 RepID=A0A4U6XAE4_9PEZI|nr:hypothetical protein CTA1_11786 [Colletotrichum tanaceti]